MARADYRVEVNIKDALNVIKDAPNVILQEAQAMAQEVAELGENEMKAIILSSGTEFSDRARQAGINKGPGRFRTGRMYNSVKSSVQTSGNNVTASFGWLGQVRKYFIYQEGGFRNKWLASYTGSGNLRVVNGGPAVFRNPYGGYKNTPGMFALRDSARSVDKEMPKFLKKYRTRITKRINKGER